MNLSQHEHPEQSDDPEPKSIGPVRYFDDRRPLDRLWLFLLRFVPKPLRTRQPFGRYFHQPEHNAWARREAERMMKEWSFLSQHEHPEQSAAVRLTRPQQELLDEFKGSTIYGDPAALALGIICATVAGWWGNRTRGAWVKKIDRKRRSR